MIPGDLDDAFLIDNICPAVAHIHKRNLPAPDKGGHQGGAHAVEFLELPGLVIDGEIGQLHGAFHNLVRLVPLHIRGPGTLDFLGEHIHRQGACDVAGFGAAHTVADHTQQCIPVQLPDFIGILIHFSDAALVCQSPTLHGKSPRLSFW